MLENDSSKILPTSLRRVVTATIPETNIDIAPENGWLEDDSFPDLGFGLFSGAFAVSFREGNTLLLEHIVAGFQVCHPLKVRDEEQISGMLNSLMNELK